MLDDKANKRRKVEIKNKKFDHTRWIRHQMELRRMCNKYKNER